VYLYFLCVVLFVLRFCIVSFMYIYSFVFCTSVKDYYHRVTTQLQLIIIIIIIIIITVNQSHYRPEVPRGFRDVKVPRLRDNGTGWW